MRHGGHELRSGAIDTIEFIDHFRVLERKRGESRKCTRTTLSFFSSCFRLFTVSSRLHSACFSASTKRHKNNDPDAGRIKHTGQPPRCLLGTRGRNPVLLQGFQKTNQLSSWYLSLADEQRFRDVDYTDLYRWHMCLSSRPGDLLAFGGSANYGRRIYYRGEAYGMQEDYSFWFDLKPVDRLLLETSFSWSRSEDEDTGATFFDSYVMRSKLGLQITRELSARIIIQYNGFYETWEGDPLLQYQINPFSIFYVGSTRDYAKVAVDPASQQEWRLTHRQYFLKLQYLFRI